MAAKWQGSGDTARSGKCQWLQIIFKYHNVLPEVLGKSAEYMPTKEARNKKISYIRITKKRINNVIWGKSPFRAPVRPAPFSLFLLFLLEKAPACDWIQWSCSAIGNREKRVTVAH